MKREEYEKLMTNIERDQMENKKPLFTFVYQQKNRLITSRRYTGGICRKEADKRDMRSLRYFVKKEIG